MSRVDELIKVHCPNGVQYFEISEIADVISGLSGKTKSDFTDGNARYVSYTNVFANLAVNQDADDFVKVAPCERQNTLHVGDVIFTGSSETPAEAGMSSVIVTEPIEPLYLNSFCFALRFHNSTSLLKPEFSKFLFRETSVRRLIAKAASGVTRFNISKDRFMKIRIPIPPIEVQREIVKVLDTFSKLEAEPEAELEAELEARRIQYAYYERLLLTQPKTTDTRWTNLCQIGRVAMCKRIFKHETSTDGDIPFYKIGTFGGKADAFISKEVFQGYKSRFSFPKKGDVLISAAGTIGRAVQYDGAPAYFQDSNIVWIDNDESIVKNKFLFYWYRIIEWSTDGGTIQRLYNDNLKRAKILVPRLSEQDRIISILDKFDALVNDLSTGLPAELNARRQQYEYYRDRLLTFQEAV